MKKLPRYTDLGDKRLNQQIHDILELFKAIPDYNVYKFTNTKWTAPLSMKVPNFDGSQRLTSPDIVRCQRAVAVGDTLTPVHFGSTTWSWAGDGEVSILDVDGLVEGTSYNLVFEVIG